MAQREYKVNLKASGFPMLSRKQERTYMTAKTDTGNYSQSDGQGTTYCHNVMPTIEGYMSVGFISRTTTIAATIADVRYVNGDERNGYYLAWSTTGQVYKNVVGSGTWIVVTTPGALAGLYGSVVTTGTVNGITYIFYSGVGCYKFDESTNALVAVTLSGLTIANILGVCDASGYLIAYTESAISWSSTVDPTDFVPSAITGAGGGNVGELKGKILFILPQSLGLFIYADQNIIIATYTGNVQYPFKLRELPESKGGVSADLVAYEANSTSQFAFTKAGFQELTTQAAKTIMPGITDYLSGKVFEDFNETTFEYELTSLSSAMQKKLTYIASRYIVISYGVTSYTHAIIYDTALDRLGKIKFDHVDVIDYVSAQVEVAKESIGFVTSAGVISTVDFSENNTGTGVLILGKLQYHISRSITLHGAEVENISSGASFSLSTRAALAGKTEEVVAGTLAYSEETLRKFRFRSYALHHSLQLIGRFNISSIIISYAPTGGA